uniref:UBP-type domain-containing protein n=1 Tax=Heterorhabditis bacteriophora TaxID=37862 RepID=A0A1I7WC04_HETBA
MSSSCFQPSSSLPPLSSSESCSQKLSIIKNHCTKLAICCPIAQRPYTHCHHLIQLCFCDVWCYSCRSEVDQSPLAHHTRVRRVTLYEAAAKCQIKSYNEYKKRVKDEVFDTVIGLADEHFFGSITSYGGEAVEKYTAVNVQQFPSSRYFICMTVFIYNLTIYVHIYIYNMYFLKLLFLVQIILTIYRLDLRLPFVNQTFHRLSTGIGSCTRSFFYPNNKDILYAGNFHKIKMNATKGSNDSTCPTKKCQSPDAVTDKELQNLC